VLYTPYPPLSFVHTPVQLVLQHNFILCLSLYRCSNCLSPNQSCINHFFKIYMGFPRCPTEGTGSASDSIMPVLIHKSVRELGRLLLVGGAIADARKILRSNNETFNCQSGGIGDKLWPDLDNIFIKFFGKGYGSKHLSNYISTFLIKRTILGSNYVRIR
jgi:hypothetical protein